MCFSCDTVDCSLPGSSVHVILQARILDWVVQSLLQGIFLTQGPNPDLLCCRQILYHVNYQGSPLCIWFVTSLSFLLLMDVCIASNYYKWCCNEL